LLPFFWAAKFDQPSFAFQTQKPIAAAAAKVTE